MRIVDSTHYPWTLHDPLDPSTRTKVRTSWPNSGLPCQGADAYTPPGGQGLRLRMAQGAAALRFICIMREGRRR